MANTESETEQSSEYESASLSEETVFDVLSSPRRRYLLYYLRTVGGTAELNEIAQQVAAWENEIEVEAVERQQRKRVYVSLYQSHVPRLTEVGIIEYDADAGVVALADGAETIDVFLAGRRDSTRRWVWYYLAAAATSTLLVGVVILGVLDLSGLVVAAVIAGAFAALAGAQFVTERERPVDTPPDVERANRRS